MFGGDDPFGFGMFGQMQRQMREMDRMMEAMMDPFGMGPRRMHPMLEGQPQMRPPRGPPVDPMSVAHPMMHPFGGLGIFGAMNNLQQRAMNDPDSHVYVQSTTWSWDGHGRPRVEERSTRKAGDVREDRRRLRDHDDTEEMEIGHAIGNRKHYIEKKRDKDGIIRSQQRFENLDEADAAEFDTEFHHRARSNLFGRQGPNNGHAALTDGTAGRSRFSSRPTPGTSSSSAQEPNGPIVTLPEEEESYTRGGRSREPGRHTGGPIIREISDEEADLSIPKRRR